MQLSELNDLELIHRARDDREAFGVLYERYVQRIYAYIFYRTGNSFDAEDLTERVFMRALRHIASYSDRGLPFSAWLYRIAHNLVANWYRDNSRRKEISLEDSPPPTHAGEHPERALVENEERERLLGLIRSLAQERQELLILKFVEDLSNAEIGMIMGRSEGAIKSLYHRTLLVLRDEMAKKASMEAEEVRIETNLLGG